jgi:hypothetical protein
LLDGLIFARSCCFRPALDTLYLISASTPPLFRAHSRFSSRTRKRLTRPISPGAGASYLMPHETYTPTRLRCWPQAPHPRYFKVVIVYYVRPPPFLLSPPPVPRTFTLTPCAPFSPLPRPRNYLPACCNTLGLDQPVPEAVTSDCSSALLPRTTTKARCPRASFLVTTVSLANKNKKFACQIRAEHRFFFIRYSSAEVCRLQISPIRVHHPSSVRKI